MKTRSIGLSLAEILVAFGLLLLGLLALLGMLPLAFRAGASADLQNQALFLAQRRMDSIIEAGQFLPLQPLSETVPGSTEFTVLTWGEDTNNSNLQTVYVDVAWLEQERARHVELKCLLAR